MYSTCGCGCCTTCFASVAGSRWSSFLQVKTLLIRAVPAVALLFGAIALAFPRVWNVTKKFGTSLQKAGGAIMKAGEAAFTVIEGLSDLPDWVWAAAMLFAALVYMLHMTIGLDRAWRWLMMTDEDANFAQRRRDREAAEAAALRSAASRPVTVKAEPLEGDGSRSLEASRAVGSRLRPPGGRVLQKPGFDNPSANVKIYP